MNLPVLLSIFALLATPQRIEFPVVVRSVESSCKFPEPGNSSLEWKDNNTALVRATVSLGAGVSVSDEPPRAFLEGTQLKVCYNIHALSLAPGGPVSMCDPLVKFEFTVSKIPRGDYEPHVFWCGLPHVLYYTCVKDGKTSYTIYKTPNCTPVFSDAP